MNFEDESMNESEKSLNWLMETLVDIYHMESARQRMREAGKVAFSLARLRSERLKVGFLPLPFGEYVLGLARIAGVAISPVLKWAFIEDASALNPKEAAGIGRLAHALGFRLEELLLSVRVAVAEQAAGAPLPMLAAHRGAAATLTARECDRVLRQIEAGWPRELRAEADALVEAASSGYRERDEAELAKE